jgi:hypothetical protein
MKSLSPRSPRVSHITETTIDHALVARVLEYKRRAMMNAGYVKQ